MDMGNVSGENISSNGVESVRRDRTNPVQDELSYFM